MPVDGAAQGVRAGLRAGYGIGAAIGLGIGGRSADAEAPPLISEMPRLLGQAGQ